MAGYRHCQLGSLERPSRTFGNDLSAPLHQELGEPPGVERLIFLGLPKLLREGKLLQVDEQLRSFPPFQDTDFLVTVASLFREAADLIVLTSANWTTLLKVRRDFPQNRLML